MNLKDYREQPDSGLFEKIAGRVRRRRLMRRAGVSVAAVVVVAGLCAVLWQADEEKDVVVNPQVALQQLPAQPKPTVVADSMEDEAVAPVVNKPDTAFRQQQVATVAKEKETVAEFVVSNPQIVPLPQIVQATVPEVRMPVEPSRQPKAESQKSQGEEIAAPVDTVDSTVDTPVKNNPPEEQPLHEDNLFWAPNIIVPAGEVEDNRTFSMKFTSAVTHFRINIYNRAGHQVFQSTDPTFVWDGTSKGTTLPQGAYVWVMKFRDSSGKLHEKHGTVTIIR